MAAGCGRHALLCVSTVVRIEFQRILPRSEHRALAPGVPGHRHRVSNAPGEFCLARVLRWGVLARESPADCVLRRGIRQRNARRTSWPGSLLLRSALD